MTKKDRELIAKLTERLENINRTVKRDYSYCTWLFSAKHIGTFDTSISYNINDALFIDGDIHYVHDNVYICEYDVNLLIVSKYRKEFSVVPGDCARYVHDVMKKLATMSDDERKKILYSISYTNEVKKPEINIGDPG